MSGRHFGSPRAINEPQPRDGAALIIRAQYNATENTVANDSRNGKRRSITLNCEYEWRLIFRKSRSLADLFIARQQ